MAGDLTLAKDWIYVFGTVITLILTAVATIFGCLVTFWWDRRKTKDERKRAAQQRHEEERQKEMQREEDRQRADAEKIAAMLSENYYEVEDIFHRLKKSVEKLRERKIVGDFTEFDVLLYMCRPDNWQKFEDKSFEINRLIQNDRESKLELDPRTHARNKVLSDVEKIMKLFLKFRINLFSIMQNKACPDDIKSEFSSKFTEMGKTIYPFVEKHRQDVIELVLEYFLSAATVQEHATPHAKGDPTVRRHSYPEDQLPCTRQRCFLCTYKSTPGVSRCYGRQETSGDETERLNNDISMRTQSNASTSSQSNASTSSQSNANRSPELTHYRGNAAIEDAIPYLICFSYQGKGCMKLTFSNMHVHISALMAQVELGEKLEKEDEILKRIDKLWRDNKLKRPGGGLLHSIRMIMFNLSEDCHFFNRCEVKFDVFVQYIKNIASADLSGEGNALACEGMLDKIDKHTSDLRGKPLLVLPETRKMLEDVNHQLDEFMSRKGQLLPQAKKLNLLQRQQVLLPHIEVQPRR